MFERASFKDCETFKVIYVLCYEIDIAIMGTTKEERLCFNINGSLIKLPRGQLCWLDGCQLDTSSSHSRSEALN